MVLLKLTIMKFDGKGSTRNPQKINGKRESDITPPIQTAPQLMRLNLLNQIVNLTRMNLHPHIVALQVMIGAERGRDPRETNIDVEKRIGAVKKSARGVIKNQSAKQEGCTILFVNSAFFGSF